MNTLGVLGSATSKMPAFQRVAKKVRNGKLPLAYRCCMFRECFTQFALTLRVSYHEALIKYCPRLAAGTLRDLDEAEMLRALELMEVDFLAVYEWLSACRQELQCAHPTVRNALFCLKEKEYEALLETLGIERVLKTPFDEYGYLTIDPDGLTGPAKPS